MNALSHIGALVVSLAMLAACQSREASPILIQLSAREFSDQIKAKGDSVLLVDVRTPEEFQTGHIEGALSLDFQGPGFAAEVAKLPKDKQLYVYCRSGRRSKASAPVFGQAGFGQVRNLEPGILGWEAAALPVRKD